MNDNKPRVSPLAATIASILVPGMGYWLIGERKRAALAGGGVILLFVLGILIAGVRVISFPGYEDGYRKYAEVQGRDPKYPRIVTTTQPAVEINTTGRRDNAGNPIYAVSRVGADGRVFIEETNDPPRGLSRWVLVRSPGAQIGDNISFLGQILNGPVCGVVGYLSNVAARHNVAKSYSRLADIGALYTAISGMLNLMIIVDAASRAAEAERRI